MRVGDDAQMVNYDWPKQQSYDVWFLRYEA